MAMPADELKTALSLRYLGFAVAGTATLSGPDHLLAALRRGEAVTGRRISEAEACRILATYQAEVAAAHRGHVADNRVRV